MNSHPDSCEITGWLRFFRAGAKGTSARLVGRRGCHSSRGLLASEELGIFPRTASGTPCGHGALHQSPSLLTFLDQTGKRATRQKCKVVVPLLDSMTRFSLRGTASGLTVVERPAIPPWSAVALFVASGGDRYALTVVGARAIYRRLGSVDRRATASPPARHGSPCFLTAAVELPAYSTCGTARRSRHASLPPSPSRTSHYYVKAGTRGIRPPQWSSMERTFDEPRLSILPKANGSWSPCSC